MPEPRPAPSALILEDEPRYRTFLSDVLRDMDCRPVQAATADEALRLVEVKPPDMLFLDLNLPVMDGLTFLEQFRISCPDTPVVIITGFGDLKSARRAIHLGVSEFLSKPCDLGQIEQAIDRARRLLVRRDASGTAAQMEKFTAQDEVRSLASVEREAILAALRQSGGNRSETARQLGISRRALYNKLAAYEREGHTVP
jgi:DNA-binding NtrC family response regulator